MDREQFLAGAKKETFWSRAPSRRGVARYIALQREKDELRRERDHLILDLAASLGPAVLAQRFGVEPPVIAKLLEGAHARLNSTPAEDDHLRAEIVARRVRAQPSLGGSSPTRTSRRSGALRASRRTRRRRCVVVEAVVFDLDGVLIDSERVWYRARRELVAETAGSWSG